VEYYISGTPKYDEKGNIINAIIFCHSFNQTYYAVNDFHELIKPGGVFDKNEYLIISTTTLGFPDSSSPSTSGLKYNFPKYSILDRVNFKRQFLKEKFGIEKVHGICGSGIGGYEIYEWACEYPDEMDFIIIGNSAFKTNGYRYTISRVADSIIDSSEGYYDDTYNQSLSRIMVSLNKIVYSNVFSKRIFQELSNEEIDVLMDDFVDEGLFIDIYDFKFLNDAVLGYDVEDKLGNIKAKSLIIAQSEDIYYSAEYDTLPVENKINNSKVEVLNKLKSIYDIKDYSEISDIISEFMEKFKK